MMTVRDASLDDAPAIRALYNALIPTTTGAWTETLETVKQRQAWLRRQHQAGWPVLVAEASAKVVGFSTYGSFRGDGRWPGLPLHRRAFRPCCTNPLGVAVWDGRSWKHSFNVHD